MQKPKNFDATVAGGEFVPVEAGAHYMRIIGVREQVSRNGYDMIVVAYDFDQKDKQANYFIKQYEGDDRAEPKWPFQGTQYIVVNDQQGNCSKNFKSFCTCVERSNKGFVIDWDAEDFCKQFKGKLIGGVFGLVESEYNGNIRKRAELRWFCEYDKVPTQKMPAEKLLPGGGASSYRPQQSAGVSNVPKQEAPAPVVDDDDIPF